jgi:pyridoxine 4-dehydrogenase
MSHAVILSAAAAGTFTIGGDLTVNRMGYGAMRITGPGIWGPPSDKKAALATLRKAVDLGVNLIDTADSYGPGTSEQLIAEALYPYPTDLVIATKGGWKRLSSCFAKRLLSIPDMQGDPLQCKDSRK